MADHESEAAKRRARVVESVAAPNTAAPPGLEVPRVVLVLSWPDRALSPNTRQHWRPHAAAKRSYRRLCWAEALEQRANVRFGAAFRGDVPLHLRLTFCPPDRRRYDRDNLLARMKAGIDGLCDALQIDDRRFVAGSEAIGEQVKGGCVRVAIEAARTE